MSPHRWLVSATMTHAADLSSQTHREQRAEKKRKGEAKIHYFHQVDDPYSHLMAQLLPNLLRQFKVQCEFHLVPGGSDDMVPERAMLETHARRDAAALASWYGLSFIDYQRPPRQDLVSIAQCILVGGPDRAVRGPTDPDLPRQVGQALWESDAIGLQKLAGDHGFSDVSAYQQNLLQGDRARRDCGHYLGATLYFEGTCYHGIDRVHYLQSRLAAQGLLRMPDEALSLILPLKESAAVVNITEAPTLVLEFFASLCSPYTYLAMERVMALCERYKVQVILRPVLPMVMRGLPVPRRKGIYIMMDAAREARTLNIPFGNIFDPVGKPVRRAYSLFNWVSRQGGGKELGFFHLLLRASFAEGRDIYAKANLRQIIEALGLSWSQAATVLDNEDWMGEMEQNRLRMAQFQCWGVPSFILSQPSQTPPLCITWGQDRLWLIEDALIQNGSSLAA